MKSKRQASGDPVLATYLPGWVARSLAEGGIRRLSQLTSKKDAELLQLRGIGPRSVEIIRLALRQARRNAKSKASANSS